MKAPTFRATPKARALIGWTRWEATGRFTVRDIMASMSWSKKWLMAFAPPAPRAPPKQTKARVSSDGIPSAARNIPPIAVITNRTMIGGFISVT